LQSSSLAFVTDFLAAIWSLFTQWTFPTTNVTPAALLLFSTTMIVGLRFVKRFMGVSGSFVDFDNGGKPGK
jgi:hypothetical protein